MAIRLIVGLANPGAKYEQTRHNAGAWFVEEPSNPQIGGSAPSGTIFVLERRSAVGFLPSIQMYSAR